MVRRLARKSTQVRTRAASGREVIGACTGCGGKLQSSRALPGARKHFWSDRIERLENLLDRMIDKLG